MRDRGWQTLQGPGQGQYLSTSRSLSGLCLFLPPLRLQGELPCSLEDPSPDPFIGPGLGTWPERGQSESFLGNWPLELDLGTSLSLSLSGL